MLLQQGGVLSLIDCTLIEEPDTSDEEGEFDWRFHMAEPYWSVQALERL